MTFNEIETITTSILEETQELLGKVELPVPIDQTVRVLFQLKVKKAKLPKEQAGKFILEDKIILVNSQDKFDRQRFTIAHELGHYCLHRKTLIKPIGASKICFSSSKETEANAFAAYLLMPRRMMYEFFINKLMDTTKKDLGWLLRILDHLPKSDIASLNTLISNYATENQGNVNLKQQLLTSLIPNMALKFGVSRDAITWRLKDLKILSHFLTKEIYDSISLNG